MWTSCVCTPTLPSSSLLVSTGQEGCWQKVCGIYERKSLKSFHVVSRVRFDDRESRPVRRQGQSALFDTSWWNSFPVFVTLGPVSVTVDEWLVGFRARCPLRGNSFSFFHVIHFGAVASENKDDDGWNTY